jgi:hypothetical protein
MGREMLESYTQGRYALLSAFYRGPVSKSIDSARDGHNFLNLLARLGLDVGLCTLRELDNLPVNPQRPERKVVFEKLENDTKILRWEWAHDASAPGYDAVSEVNALAGHADPCPYESTWPFKEFQARYYKDWVLATSIYYCTTPKRLARFNRCTAAKHLKGRAQTSRKQHRSRMPGT